MASGLRDWMVDRFGLEPIRQTVLYRRVAKGAWYFGDGATLMLLLGTQAATGGFLMLTYSPSPEGAYESVAYITNQQTLGWFLRALHYWSGGLMVVMLVFHLFRQILVGGYKAPREGTWLIGVMLFFLVIIMSFTGYVLRWDERGIHGLRVALHAFNHVPLVGDGLVLFVQGGPEIGPQTLTRIYAVHVFFVPLVLLALLGFHLYLVMYHGVTSPTERLRGAATAEEQRKIYEEDKNSPQRGEQFYPETAFSSGVMAVLVFLVAVGLALILGPRELEPKANLTERAFPVEEWWFWWYSALIAITPPRLAPVLEVLFPVVLFVVLVALPLVDRGPARGIRNRPIAATVVVLLTIALFYLSSLRLQSPWTGWPDPELPAIPRNIELTPRAAEGRVLFAKYGCTSCHAVAGVGRRMGTDLAALEYRYSRDELKNYVLQPPPGVAMPSYREVISPEDLDRVVEFVLVVQTGTPRVP